MGLNATVITQAHTRTDKQAVEFLVRVRVGSIALCQADRPGLTPILRARVDWTAIARRSRSSKATLGRWCPCAVSTQRRSNSWGAHTTGCRGNDILISKTSSGWIAVVTSMRH